MENPDGAGLSPVGHVVPPSRVIGAHRYLFFNAEREECSVKNIFSLRRARKFLDPARATHSAEWVPTLVFESLPLSKC